MTLHPFGHSQTAALLALKHGLPDVRIVLVGAAAREGKEEPKERRGRNPFTGETIVFRAPPRPRRRRKYVRS